MDPNANQKVSCIVNYTYEASEPDELSLRSGDVVRDVDRLPGGWWRGELRGRRGMFPDNFVSVVDNDQPRSSSGVQGRCRAVFSYQPANSDELPLCVGDVLDVLGEVEEGWWQGRRSGRVGVFPSNFVVMLEPPAQMPSYEPAPALPPKPVKELCRVLFPYQAVNEDELTLTEGDIVNVVSKDAPDRGWWRGELNGKTGLFPDNFVQLLPPVTHDTEEKKPERPPSKTPPLYPVLNKYSEKTATVQELTTQKTSLHKDNSFSKESSAQSTITQTNKSDSEKIIHSETTYTDAGTDQVKKPPVPTKKSPVGGGVVGGLLSGLRGKTKSIISTDKSIDKQDKSSTVLSSGSSTAERDRTDGAALSRSPAVPPAAPPAVPTAAPPAAPATPAGAFDHVERASMLNDPRAQRAKAPRRRPPSQAFRDDAPPPAGMSNGHDTHTNIATTNNHSDKPEKSPERDDGIKPRSAREWEKNKVPPWMAELKKTQAKKTDKVEKVERSTRSVSSSSAGSGSTDRILEVGLEEKRSCHSMEMSKSTSSISTRMTVMDSLDESTTRVRSSLDSKKDAAPAPPKEDGGKTNNAQSPTAAGRTFSNMLEEVKKPVAPAPPAASARTSVEAERAARPERGGGGSGAAAGQVAERTSTIEKVERTSTSEERSGGAAERRGHVAGRAQDPDPLVAQLNCRITNLEKLLEAQNAKFNAAIEELSSRLAVESSKRAALQAELQKLAHCVTQV